MSAEKEISQEELQAQSGQEVPDREAMSLVNANLALPINAAIAANVLSDGSIAYANAIQQANIPQHT
jgi:secreted protein with Ig-like and vWFA domain